MASVRNLKKDLEFVSNELIFDCFTYQLLYKKNEDVVNEMIEQIKNSYYNAINSINIDNKSKSKKEIKLHYQAIVNDFQANINEVISKLDSLEK